MKPWFHCTNIVDFLSVTTQNLLFKSKGEARKAIQANSVSINKEKVNDIEQDVNFDLLQDKYVLAQHGKKKYFLIKVNN